MVFNTEPDVLVLLACLSILERSRKFKVILHNRKTPVSLGYRRLSQKQNYKSDKNHKVVLLFFFFKSKLRKHNVSCPSL